MYILYIIQVQEWFKNRRKKDRLLQDRAMGRKLPKCHRSRKSTTSTTSVVDEHNRETPTSVEVDENDIHVGDERRVPEGHVPLLQDTRGVEDSSLVVASSNAVATSCSRFMLQM